MPLSHKKLHQDAFISQQTLGWALLKFRMLLWIVNGLTGGAPGTNSAKFEAALRIYVTRILKRASGNHDCLCDVAEHYILRATLDRLRAVGGPVAAALAKASKLPARCRLLNRCSELSGGAALSLPIVGAPPAAHVAAMSADWAAVSGNVGPVPGAAVDFRRVDSLSRRQATRRALTPTVCLPSSTPLLSKAQVTGPS